MMVQFLDLPQELILLVAETIPERKTILSLWSTNRLLQRLLTAQAFFHLVLDFRGEPRRVRSAIEHLGALADGTAFACRYARTLEIWSLRNLYDGRVTKYTLLDCEEMLERALSRLEGVESMGWLAGWSDITSIEEGALKGIKSLVASHPNFNASVATFRRGSKSLVIEELQGICTTYALPTDQWGMNAQYSGLKYDCRRDTSMLAFRLDMTDTPHGLQLLTDISAWLPITNFKSIQTLQFADVPTDIFESIFSQRTFWLALQHSGLQPIEFYVDFITDPLLDMLKSFSKLRYLCLKDARADEDVHSTEELADKFFKEVLWAHQETLQTLVVDVAVQGPWFFQHSNLEDLAVCQKLKRLAIGLLTPIDATSEDLLLRALNLRKSLPYLYQLSILETGDDGITPGGDSRFDLFIKAFSGKGSPITALGTRRFRYKGRHTFEGSEKALRYYR